MTSQNLKQSFKDCEVNWMGEHRYHVECNGKLHVIVVVVVAVMALIVLSVS